MSASLPRAASMGTGGRVRVVPFRWMLVIGCMVAVLGAWQSGTFAAVPAGCGLVFLVVADAAQRRVSPRIVGITGLATLSVLAADSARGPGWSSLLGPILVAALVGIAMLTVWVVARGGVGFGDVFLSTVAVLVPARISVNAALWTLLAAFMAAGALVALRRLQVRSAGPSCAAVPFAVALLIEGVVGLWVG